MSSDQFTDYPKPSLNRKNVVNYLLPFKNKGWDIYQGSHPEEFIIKVTNLWNVTISHDGHRWVVFGGNHWAISYPENLLGLEQAIKSAIEYLGRQDGEILNWSESLR